MRFSIWVKKEEGRRKKEEGRRKKEEGNFPHYPLPLPITHYLLPIPSHNS
jgi:hypothetical protein